MFNFTVYEPKRAVAGRAEKGATRMVVYGEEKKVIDHQEELTAGEVACELGSLGGIFDDDFRNELELELSDLCRKLNGSIYIQVDVTECNTFVFYHASEVLIRIEEI